jgi:hypothetical protein
VTKDRPTRSLIPYFAGLCLCMWAFAAAFRHLFGAGPDAFATILLADVAGAALAMVLVYPFFGHASKRAARLGQCDRAFHHDE